MALRNRPLKMGNKRVEGVLDAVDDKDAVNKSQLDAVAATIPSLTGYVQNTRAVNTGTGLSGGGNLSADRTIILADTAVTPGAYTNANITVDQQGRLTAASSGAASTFTTVFKTSDQSVTSSTAFTDATSLSFAVTSGTYAFTFIVPATSGAGGIKFAVNGPTLTSLYAAPPGGVAVTAYDTSISATSGAASIVWFITGIVTVSASGTFTLRFAQNSSNIAASTILAGSYVDWARVA